MKFTKLTIFAVIIAFLAISLFMTFGQEAFTQTVTANFLLFKTPEIPVLYYIAGAFILGLVIGVFIAIHEHVAMAKRMRIIKKEFSEENKNLKEQVEMLNKSIEVAENKEEE